MKPKVEATLQREIAVTPAQVIVITDKWRNDREECIQILEKDPDETQIIEDDETQTRLVDGPKEPEDYNRWTEYEELV